MGDDTAIVDQDPARLGSSFTAWDQFVLLECFLNIIGDGAELAVALSGCDDEKIGERRNLVGVEQQDVFTLLVLDQFNNGAS